MSKNEFKESMIQLENIFRRIIGFLPKKQAIPKAGITCFFGVPN